jgi:hypothetical protein
VGKQKVSAAQFFQIRYQRTRIYQKSVKWKNEQKSVKNEQEWGKQNKK